MIERFNTKDNAKIAINIVIIFLYEIVFLAFLMSSYENYFFYYSNGYVMFFLMYLAIYTVFGRLFSALELGEATTTDLFLSHSLTLLFSNIFIYLILCLITLRLLPPWPMLLTLVIQMAIAALLLYLGNHFIRRTYPPVKVVAIRGESHYDLIGKLNNIRDPALE